MMLAPSGASISTQQPMPWQTSLTTPSTLSVFPTMRDGFFWILATLTGFLTSTAAPNLCLADSGASPEAASRGRSTREVTSTIAAHFIARMIGLFGIRSERRRIEIILPGAQGSIDLPSQAHHDPRHRLHVGRPGIEVHDAGAEHVASTHHGVGDECLSPL